MANTIEQLIAPIELTWPEIWKLIQAAIKKLGQELKDPKKWKVSVNGKAAGPVSDVSLDVHGLTYKFKYNNADHTISAVPDSHNHAGVIYDGAKDDGAHVVVSLRSQPPLKPVIVVVEFVNVTSGNQKLRIRFDCPK